MTIKNPTNRNLKILHKRLWTWLAENPSKEKWQWPGWKDFENNPKFDVSVHNDCFACEEATKRVLNAHSTCKACPIKWAGSHCNGYNGEFMDWWQTSNTFAEKSALATKIANLYWSDKGAK